MIKASPRRAEARPTINQQSTRFNMLNHQL